jgi:hypothetical protein
MKNIKSNPGLNKRLAGYSAAAVAIAAISTNSDAQVAYSGLKNITVKMTNDTIDMDGDGIKDFAIMNFMSGPYNYAIIQNLQSSNKFMGNKVYALASSSYIATSYSFYNGYGLLGSAQGSSYWGNFPGQGDRFIGVKFMIGTDIHLGWIRVNIPLSVDSIIIKDWAYEKTANQWILTGDNGSPELSGVTVNKIGLDTAVFNFTSNMPAWMLYGVKKADEPAPAYDEILADTTFITSGSQYISARSDSIELSGLEPNSSYKIYTFMIGASNDTSAISNFAFSTIDTIAPTLSLISVSSIIKNSAIAHFTPSEIGTAYFGVKKISDPAPVVDDLKAGSGFIVSGNAVVTAGNSHAFNLTGLLEANSYKVYIIVEDSSNNVSKIYSKNFTTASTLGINDIKDESVTIYPNPAKNFMNITVPEKSEYSVVDLLGKTVQNGKLEVGISLINIRGIGQGMYFVHLNFNGSSVIKQIIIK